MEKTRNEISDVTRRNLSDAIMLSDIPPFGGFADVEFLARLYNLRELPSEDGRYTDAGGDIWQHMTMNRDWSDDWFWTDERFNLLYGSDEDFLRFLCEMVHPMVRSDQAQITQLVQIMNEHLAADGWEITERGKISGKSVYGGRRRLLDSGVGVKAAKDLAVEFDATYLSQQTTRMEAAMQSDPELAIGSAKEFVETICKTILKERAIPLPPADDFPQLVRTTIKSLRLVPEAISDGSGGEQIIKIFLNNLGSISNTLAALRNPYGTGHGKEATHEGLEEHHARLAVGVATAFGVFLYEAHKNTPSN